MLKRKVLNIGQLPKESGGTYTTGIARVVENLYQKNFGDVIMYWYFTNVPQAIAGKKCTYVHQYNGYRKLPIQMLWNLVRNPLETIRAWKYYKRAEVNPIRYEFYRANFAKVLSEVKPDLIHIHGAGLQPLYYANKKWGAPIVITFHGVMYNQEDVNSHHFLHLYQDQIKMADYFTVLNGETMRKALALGMPENKCTTIPNGVDTSRFYYSKEQREKIRSEYNVSKGCQVFITTGVVIDRKGQFDFLHILETLDIDYQYWIVGKGPDEQKINNYVTEHHLEERVKMLGYVDGRELYKYLSAADFYAHVSTTEGQALSEIEAYATGLRVVVRKEIKDTVVGDADNDSKNYFVLNMNYVDNTLLKSWLRDSNDERVSRGNYDWALVARQYGELYQMLLSLKK